MCARVGMFFLAVLAAVSCSSGSTLVLDTTEPVQDAAVTDLAAPKDIGWPDVQAESHLPDLSFKDQFHLDLPAELPPMGCLPGEGCFLDKCTENSDCLSGWCVEHMGEGVCSETCVDECPQGWSCKQVGASDPDLVYVCVSDHSNLCKPCNSGDSCKAAGGADDVCVDYGEGGAFCGGACTETQDCPWGFTCLDTQTIDGIGTTQCVADTGSCPCTEKSVALALWTPCDSTNDFGECAGKRICAAGGLQECDAATPLAETCNANDDDCDGLVDEPDDVAGVFVPLCDDGNQCTDDLCNGADGCENQPLSEGECMDGDPCTAADHCEEGQCLGNPVLCDDDNPCTHDSCDGTGGCLFEENTADCDDGDPCTVADQCEEGICSGTAIPCDCQAHEDCATFEDGDLCNGTLVCNTEDWPYNCVVDPETVVLCPAPPPGPDSLCLIASCDPGSADCSLVPDHQGFPCDDQDLCSIGDSCVDGTCTAGVPANCKDDNPCTEDSCFPASGCQFTPNDQPCTDGDVCTTGDTCSDGECGPGAPLVCDDADLCNGAESCDPATGCKPGVSLLCDQLRYVTSLHPALAASQDLRKLVA